MIEQTEYRCEACGHVTLVEEEDEHRWRGDICCDECGLPVILSAHRLIDTPRETTNSEEASLRWREFELQEFEQDRLRYLDLAAIKSAELAQ